MQFNSIDFMCFFPVVLIVYFIVPRRMRDIWLLIASYYFYMSWNPKYAVLIAFSTFITYASALLMDGISVFGKKWIISKKLIMVACLICNLFILGIFKYGNFVLESVNVVLRSMGIGLINRQFDLLLPVGISFYTFQALGYIIDVYRGDVKAENNLLRYSLFVSFFPQLVAGPIERSKNLLCQVNNTKNMNLWESERISSGAILMVWGFFMKMVIADRISILVDTVFNNYRMYGSTELCFAAVAFSIQIYCDFGSYSIIAIGAAKIMGFTLMENFNTPYFALSIKDFWRRWHISLSSWFRDYLYIPLGGSQKNKFRRVLNKLFVFMVSGLWHGANWSYVAWGSIHGFYQVGSDALNIYKAKLIQRCKIKTECFSWKLLQIIVTYIMVDFAWIFFRADSITDALRFIFRIFIRPTPWILFNGEIFNLGLDRVEMNILIFSLLLLFMVDIIRYKKQMTLDAFLMEQNIWFRWSVVIGLIVMIFVFGEYGPTFDAQQFIYFQF